MGIHFDHFALKSLRAGIDLTDQIRQRVRERVKFAPHYDNSYIAHAHIRELKMGVDWPGQVRKWVMENGTFCCKNKKGRPLKSWLANPPLPLKIEVVT